MKRRDFIRLLGMGGVIVSTTGAGFIFNSCDDNGNGGSGSSMLYDPRTEEGFTNQLLLPGDEGVLGILEPTSFFEIRAKELNAELLPDKSTANWLYEVNYNGRLYYNPIIKIGKGDMVNARLVNELSEETIIHWHGLEVDQQNDGHPNNAVPPGGTYDYDFSVPNRGATYWYHPHPDRLVGEQAFFGLGGFFIVEDEDELNLRDSLDLELGVTDIPLIIQDRNFDEDGNLVFDINPMLQTLGVLGDNILVNRTVKPYMDVDTRIYRFRMLNASNSRTYRLSLQKGEQTIPFHVIGNDGGLLDQPYQAEEVFLGVAERIEILVDFRGQQPGEEIFLRSLFFDRMDPLVDGMEFNRPTTLMNGDEFNVIKFNVSNNVNYTRQIPDTLSSIDPIDISGADERFVALPNPIEGTWFINNFRFEPNETPITVNRDTIETWIIQNAPLAMPHPMHIHAFQFQILERINSPDHISRLAIDENGRMPADMGWNDTVLVWPGESVRYAINFKLDYEGDQLYLFHCHNLEHEDQGMMINYMVV